MGNVLLTLNKRLSKDRIKIRKISNTCQILIGKKHSEFYKFQVDIKLLKTEGILLNNWEELSMQLTRYLLEVLKCIYHFRL